MEKVAFIVHPPNVDFFRSYVQIFNPSNHWESCRNEELIQLCESLHPIKIKEFTHLSIGPNQSIDATIILVPFLPEMRNISLKSITNKIDEALHIAVDNKCTIAAMGGFTSIVLQGQEDTYTQRHGIKITSGNTLTAVIINTSIDRVSKSFGIDLSKTSMAIIGASGDIGSACLGYFGSRVKRLYATGRSVPSINNVISRFSNLTCNIVVTSDNKEAITNSQICIFVTSSADYLFNINDFNPGTIICDASFPLNVNVNEQSPPDNVFIYHGGIANTPFNINIGSNIGIPSYTFYGCQLEGLLIGLYPDKLPCSWGRGNITQDKLKLFTTIFDKCNTIFPAFSLGHNTYTYKQLKTYTEKWKDLTWNKT